jgi:transposase InsO family protein
MQNLFQPDAAAEVISRIDKLQPATQHQWGKMDVAQMMAHCSATLDMASGRVVLPRMLIGRILGPFVRHVFTDEKPFSKNGPTNKNLVIADKRDFAREQEQLKTRVRQFHAGGEAQCTKHPHPFLGPITPPEWATGMYKHLDHHLRQFGV